MKSIVNDKIGFYAKKNGFEKTDKEFEMINRYDSNSDSDYSIKSFSGKNVNNDSENEENNLNKKDFKLKTDKMDFKESNPVQRQNIDSQNFKKANFKSKDKNQILEDLAIDLNGNISGNASKANNFINGFPNKLSSVKDRFKNLDYNYKILYSKKEELKKEKLIETPLIEEKIKNDGKSKEKDFDSKLITNIPNGGIDNVNENTQKNKIGNLNNFSLNSTEKKRLVENTFITKNNYNNYSNLINNKSTNELNCSIHDENGDIKNGNEINENQKTEKEKFFNQYKSYSEKEKNNRNKLSHIDYLLDLKNIFIKSIYKKQKSTKFLDEKLLFFEHIDLNILKVNLVERLDIINKYDQITNFIDDLFLLFFNTNFKKSNVENKNNQNGDNYVFKNECYKEKFIDFFIEKNQFQNFEYLTKLFYFIFNKINNQYFETIDKNINLNEQKDLEKDLKDEKKEIIYKESIINYFLDNPNDNYTDLTSKLNVSTLNLFYMITQINIFLIDKFISLNYIDVTKTEKDNYEYQQIIFNMINLILS